MLWRSAYHKRIAQLADGLTTAFSFILAYFVWDWIRLNTKLGVGQPIRVDWGVFWKILIFSIIWVIIFERFKAYTYQRFTSLSREFAIVSKTTIVGLLVFFASFFFFRLKYLPRTYILIFGFFNFFSLSLEKVFLYYVAKTVRKRGKNRKKILVVGTGKKAIEFVKKVEENLEWGLDIIGYLGEYGKEKKDRILGKEVLGTFSEIVDVLHNNFIDEVIICIPFEEFKEAKVVLENCEREGVQVRINSDFFGYLVKRVAVDYVYELPIVSFYSIPVDEWALYLKRFIDIFISGIILILLLPLFGLIAFLIKITSKGPVFYEWKLIGLNKKPFSSYKFRTMVENAEKMEKQFREKNINEMNGVYFKLKKDPRITQVGQILRKFSIDELPQLWSVFQGNMSLVGPRPVRQIEKSELKSWHRRRFSVRPGVTSPWVVSGKNKINDFDDIARLDLSYIDNWSFWKDLWILLKTIPIILLGKNT